MKPKATKKEEVRFPPRRPMAIEPARLGKYLSSGNLFPDVTSIHCKLGQFSHCRGLEIGLYDSNGELVDKAHTGASGLVGFEGLQTDTEYLAKIEGEKYFGEVQIRAGGAFGITGERR